MTSKTKSEELFEAFCSENLLAFERIPEGASKTPDYRVRFGSLDVLAEVKQIDDDEDFDRTSVSSRTVGTHVRSKIASARAQLTIFSQHSPTILVLYNNLDPFQAFGTEQHDFVAGMYGDMTLYFRGGRIVGSAYGDNGSMRKDRNTTFSAVGHLCNRSGQTTLRLFENVYARTPLPSEAVPDCIEYIRVQVE